MIDEGVVVYAANGCVVENQIVLMNKLRRRYPVTLLGRSALLASFAAFGLVLVNLVVFPAWHELGVGRWLAGILASRGHMHTGSIINLVCLHIPGYLAGGFIGVIIGRLRHGRRCVPDLAIFACFWAALPWIVLGAVSGMDGSRQGMVWVYALAGLSIPIVISSGWISASIGGPVELDGGRCPNCGYSTFMLPTSTCPECGADVSQFLINGDTIGGAP